MTIHLPSGRVLAAILALSVAPGAALAADAVTPAMALKFRPMQKDVDFDQPGADEIDKCTIKPEKIAGKSGWVLKNGGGQILRIFVDVDANGAVDQRSYFKDGVEVYRDVDTNHNGQIDQSRWLNAGGTRWAIDKNEDHKIDHWQIISPEEVSAEVVAAVRDNDAARFERLLITPSELNSLGLSKAKLEELQKRVAAAPAAFAEYLKTQKVVNSSSVWTLFAGSRPGIVPTGTDDSTADITVYENVAALADTDGKSSQLPIGTLIKVGDLWRLIDAPGDAAAGSLAGGAGIPTKGDDATPGSPSAKARELMDEYQALDQKDDHSTAANERRLQILVALAEETKTVDDKIQWLRQAADVVSEAVQRGAFPDGVERLKELPGKLGSDSEDLSAYVQFRVMTAEYNKSLQSPNVDYAKVQAKWLADLEQFVKDHPSCSDAAEAMLQLAIAQEFAGDDSNAIKWYRRVTENFPKSASAVKAEGARRRIESVGNAISIKGKTLGGKALDLTQLKGKVVLVHYWDSSIEPCRADMAQLEKMMKKYGENFVVVGVSFDSDPKALVEYLRDNDYRWPQLWEEGGQAGRLANEMGILTLPTMLLIDAQGKVLSRNVSAAGLDGELKQILKPQVANRNKGRGSE
jgi:thiol-disulfide isomerase/thioredoxin